MHFRNINSIIITVAAMFVVGCRPAVNEYMSEVNPLSWYPASAVEVLVTNPDTCRLCKMDLLVAYIEEPNTIELSLNLTVYAPDSTHFKDELSLLPNVSCREQDDSRILRFPYMDSVRLSQNGTYVFSFAPLREIKGVKAVGVSLEEY